MLSEIDQRRFIVIMCLRCCNGSVTLQDSEVAFQLRISDQEWMVTKQALLAKNLIGDDNKPVAWEKRQFDSDTSNARVAKHREKKKQQCNVTVAAKKRRSNAPETETETEKYPPTPQGGDSRFDQFWKAYPRKQGKGAAEKAFAKAKLNGHFEFMLTALELQKQSEQWQKGDGQFIPNPATWINQRRWQDEVMSATGSSSSIFEGVE
jgi:hypothetical protein